MNQRILSVPLLAVLLLFATESRSQDSREIDKTVALKTNGELIIDTYKGSITITTWDKAQVGIHAKIEADEEFDSKYAAEKVKDTEIRVDESDGRVKIKTDYDNVREHSRGFWSLFDDVSGSLPFVHYTITMPRTANLRIKDYKSQTSVTELSAAIDINTYKGEVAISKIAGSLKLETYKGEVNVSFAKLSEKCRFETYKGKLKIVLPKNTGFDLDADLGSRADFNSDFDVELRTHGKHRRNADFRGPVNGGGTSIIVKSEKGTIDLRQS